MAFFEITPDRLRPVPGTTFAAAGVRERDHLQRLLRAQIEIVSEDTLVIAEEFRDWEDSNRRIDLLGLDKNANLVVIELKRTEDGGHMELQALRYAAMISTMTFDKVEEVYTDYLRSLGTQLDARTSILNFLGWKGAEENPFAQDVRIVLVSAEFSKELTTSVMWLNKQGLDIRCIRLKPYADNGRVLIDVQQIIPLPEAAEYQFRIREKQERDKTARQGQLYSVQDVLDYLIDPTVKTEFDRVLADMRSADAEIRPYKNGKYRWVEFVYGGEVIAYVSTLQKAFKFQHYDPDSDDWMKAVFDTYSAWEQQSKPWVVSHIARIREGVVLPSG